MPKKAQSAKASASNRADVGYEAKLWHMADEFRGSMDAPEYKHVVLDLIFLNYISGAFEELYGKLEGDKKQSVDAVVLDGVHGAIH